jgi:hypothetical protein
MSIKIGNLRLGINRRGLIFEWLNTRLLSEDQDFIVPSDAPNGEYVGIIKAYPEFEEIGDAPVFTLVTNVDNIYSVSATGLISIADNTFLAVAVDVITVTITKTGFVDQTINVTITVLNTANCTYLDPGFWHNGVGTRIDPKNAIPAITDNMILLFKRGTQTVRVGMLYIDNKDAWIIGSYGTGALPIISGNNHYIFRVYSTHATEGCTNAVVRDLSFTSNAALTPDPDYANWSTGAVYGSSTKVNFWFIHNECSFLINGLTFNSNGQPSNDYDLTLKWNYVHDTSLEGLYLQKTDNLGEASCNKITRVNLKWFFNEAEATSSGDGIQTFDVHLVNMKHNYVDHSFTGNKFCLIPQYNHAGVDGTEWVEVSDNYLISNLGGTAGALSGAIIYADFNRGVITRNYFKAINGARGIALPWGSVDIEVSYNIFDKCNRDYAVSGLAINTYNNVFYDFLYCVLLAPTAMKNNIFYFVGNAGEYAYNGAGAAGIDYNLFNQEQANMFGVGRNNIAGQTGEDHSVVGDPQFVDLANRDFRIKASSPGIGIGAFLGIVYDYYYRHVGATPDIGVNQRNGV